MQIWEGYACEVCSAGHNYSSLWGHILKKFLYHISSIGVILLIKLITVNRKLVVLVGKLQL